MPLDQFPFLQENTGLVKFKETLYKLKIRYDMDTFLERTTDFSETAAHDDLEQVFRAVLYMSERNQDLKPILTQNFIIKPRKTSWSFPRKYTNYVFKQDGKSLRAFPFMFELNISNRSNTTRNRSGQEESQMRKNENNNDKSQVKGVANESVKKNEIAKLSKTGLQKSGKRQELITVDNVGNDEIQSPRFKRTKDGRLYRQVDVKASVLHEEQKDNTRTTRNQTNTANSQNTRSKPIADSEIGTCKVNKRTSETLKSSDDHEVKQMPKRKSEAAHHSLFSPIRTRQNKTKFSPYSLRSGSEHEKNTMPVTETGMETEAEDLRISRRAQRQSGRIDHSIKIGMNESSRKHNTTTKSKKNNRLDDSISSSSQTDSEFVNYKNIKKTRSIRNSKDRCSFKIIVKRRRNRTSNRNSSDERDSKTYSNTKAPMQKRRSERLAGKGDESQSQTNSEVEHKTTKKRDGMQERYRNSNYSESMDSQDSSQESEPVNKKRKLRRSVRVARQGTSDDSPFAVGVAGQGTSEDSQTTDMESDAEKQQKVVGESTSDSKASRSRRHKLYVTRQSPQAKLVSGSRMTGLTSTRVSEVHPVKRDNFSYATQQSRSHGNVDKVSAQQHSLASRKLTRQSMNEQEVRRIESMRAEGPTRAYRDTLLNHGRDRHVVEQAERAETDKLQQLYKPTIPSSSPATRSQRVTRRKSSGIWGRIMDNLVTPTKKFMEWK